MTAAHKAWFVAIRQAWFGLCCRCFDAESIKLFQLEVREANRVLDEQSGEER